MSGDIKHNFRQIYYRWCKWKASPFYTAFSKMYALENTFWPTVHRHPNMTHFILSDFTMPIYKPYSGREIAVFNGQQIAVYWLPGAQHSGGGYVESGEHYVKLHRHTLKKPLYIAVTKSDQATSINDLSLSPTQTYFSSDGGFVPYQAINQELTSLMIQWLNRIEKNWEHYSKNTHFSKTIQTIIDLCLQLPDNNIQLHTRNLAIQRKNQCL